MKTHFEPCFCLDLGALRTADADDAEPDDQGSVAPAVTESCAGKTLLMLTARGFEVVHVPTLLH